MDSSGIHWNPAGTGGGHERPQLSLGDLVQDFNPGFRFLLISSTTLNFAFGIFDTIGALLLKPSQIRSPRLLDERFELRLVIEGGVRLP